MRALLGHLDQIRERNGTPPALRRELELISPDDWQKYSAETVEIRKMIFGYREKVI